MSKTEAIPDQDGLKRLGKSVRERLEADPGVYKVETDKVDLFAVGDFLTLSECNQLCAMIDDVARPSSLHEIDYASGFRTSYSGDLDRADSFVMGISRRIDDLLGVNPVIGEAIQVTQLAAVVTSSARCDGDQSHASPPKVCFTAS